MTSILSTYVAAKFLNLIGKPFEKWDEYPTIINADGSLVSKSNIRQIDPVVNIARKIRIVLKRYLKSDLAIHAVQLFLIKEDINPQLDPLRPIFESLNDVIETNWEKNFIEEFKQICLLHGARIFQEEVKIINDVFDAIKSMNAEDRLSLTDEDIQDLKDFVRRINQSV